MKFNTGKILVTETVSNLIEHHQFFSSFCNSSLRRHIMKDWGDLCEDDKLMNDLAIENENDRILSSYDIPKELQSQIDFEGNTKIWIITEATRDYTTILLPSEY
ncbi:hypothetical protein PG275_10365 [Riemerella anatipestifer]|nr:hypothetical protein [Riemerella anatipestifer]